MKVKAMKNNYEAQDNMRLIAATVRMNEEIYKKKREDKKEMAKWVEEIDAMLLENPICYSKNYLREWTALRNEVCSVCQIKGA